MSKVFIGGSRKWDMFPEDIIMDINKIIDSLYSDANYYGDEIVVGDCPEGIDIWTIERVIALNAQIFSDSLVKLTVVTNGEFPRVIDKIYELKRFYRSLFNTDISVISLRDLYKKGELAEFLDETTNHIGPRDIHEPDWNDQSLKDEWMLEHCDIHRFIWNGKSRATQRNTIMSVVENSLIFTPRTIDERVVWSSKFTWKE